MGGDARRNTRRQPLRTSRLMGMLLWPVQGQGAEASAAVLQPRHGQSHWARRHCASYTSLTSAGRAMRVATAILPGVKSWSSEQRWRGPHVAMVLNAHVGTASTNTP